MVHASVRMDCGEEISCRERFEYIVKSKKKIIVESWSRGGSKLGGKLL